MIQSLLTILGQQHRAQVIQYGFWLLSFAILQGLAMVMLVPLLTELIAGELQQVWRLLSWLLILVVFACVARYQQTVRGAALAILVLNTLHQRLGEHLAQLPLGWFSGERVGRLSRSATGGTLMVTNVFAHLLPPVVCGVVTPMTVVVAMLWFDWRLGLVALGFMPLIYFTHRKSADWIGKMETQVDSAGAQASNKVVEFARHQAVLRAFGKHHDGYEPLELAIAEQGRAAGSMLRQTFPRLLAGGLMIQLAFATIVAVGIWLHLHYQLPAVELVALLALTARFTGPLAELAGRSGLMRMANNDLSRLAAIFAEKPLLQPLSSATPQSPSRSVLNKTIEFCQVSFGYTPEKPVLRQVSFSALAGTTTAIVGASGSGKTTITRLIARFFDVEQGQVKIDGVDVRQLRNEDLLAKISMVTQQVYLFSDTLEANVLLAKPDASREALERAARLAGVEEIVARLPQGWHTQVGEGGTALSGGERQRVSIARAILKNAPIVVFDEATAALDPSNTRFITQSMKALKQHATLVVIAHQLSTVKDADQIVVLDEGEVVELGIHQQLLEQQGRYAYFWQQRRSAAQWSLVADCKVANETNNMNSEIL